MKYYWELVQGKVESMPLRERTIIFVAIAFSVIALTSMMLLNPLLEKQKVLSKKLAQQQGQMSELQSKINEFSKAKQEIERSPLNKKVAELKQKIEVQDGFIKDRRNRLVDPDKMAGMLEQVLNKNGKLQLVVLETLPVILVMDSTKKASAGQKQIYKHSVKITLRGGYLDLLEYLAAVESASVQVYWGDASFRVVKQPEGELTLLLYTLSLDKSWLKV